MFTLILRFAKHVSIQPNFDLQLSYFQESTHSSAETYMKVFVFLHLSHFVYYCPNHQCTDRVCIFPPSSTSKMPLKACFSCNCDKYCENVLLLICYWYFHIPCFISTISHAMYNLYQPRKNNISYVISGIATFFSLRSKPFWGLEDLSMSWF